MDVIYATPPPDEHDDELAAALTRFLATKSAPLYLRTPAEAWLAQHTTP